MRKRQVLKLFLTATAVALGLRLFFIEDFRIVSGSMAPGLLTGDIVLVSKSAFSFRFPFSSYELVRLARPKVGDVVAFSLPDHGIQTYVKRVVALAGDRVEIREGVLYVNGEPSTYERVPESAGLFWESRGGNRYLLNWETDKPENYGPVDVPKDHFFSLGDNRGDSIDSRAWGPVPYSSLQGRVKWVWLSVEPNGSVRWNRIGYWVR